MSFFRNIRSTITRGKSSSRDNTPVRASTTSSRTSSVLSNATGRRDSLESRTESLLNRSDTFILDEQDESEDKNHSNTSTLEKKSKKSKVLSKFSTFTKRKKTPTPPENAAYEHHPSDDATNTYYKWKSESGPSNLDYDSQTDPFNFLYEQQSSLKSMQYGTSLSAEPTRAEIRGNSASAMFDSSTYRKSKMPTQLKERLEQLKTYNTPELHEEEPELESDKYKTVTLNSFRKSFRDKFLQQQKDAPHNPAWFVEVESPETKEMDGSRHQAKENRADFLVFDNENYRPGSRSPVRDRNGRSARSPIKRNETFRVERPSIEAYSSTAESQTLVTPSIRIEIKNSIAPHMPGRLVPVGVAKPMPSPYITEYNMQRGAMVPAATTMTRLNSTSPLRNWSKPIATPPPARNPSSVNRSSRFQTLVQIRNDTNATKPSIQSTTTPLNNNNTRSRLATTRVQLGGASPITQKRLNTVSMRYSQATPHPSYLSSYELLKNSATPQSGSIAQKPSSTQLYAKAKHTYFGETQPNFSAAPTARANAWSGSSNRTVPAPASKVQLQQQPRSSLAVVTGSSNSSNYNNNYYGRRDLPPQTRVVVPTQRRSRSPIKMPWR